jgi:hypothetical protein
LIEEHLRSAAQENASLKFDTSFWLGAFGSITGSVALIYSRRQALAAEGPTNPEIEVLKEGGNGEGWYAIEIITRNKTHKSWDLRTAAVRSPKGSKIVAAKHISSYDAGGRYRTVMPSLEIASNLSSVTTAASSVWPAGTSSSLGAGDQCREEFFILLPRKSRHWHFFRRNSLSILFTFEDRAATPRRRYIKLRRTIRPS